MIDAKDQGTQNLDLGDTPKRRGRPSTGNAMSNADRQRAYRERQKSQRNEKAVHQGEDPALLREALESLGERQLRLEDEHRAHFKRANAAEDKAEECRLIAVEISERCERAEQRVKELEKELASRNGNSKTEAAGGAWTLEFKAKGQRKWTRLEKPLTAFGPEPMTLQDVKNHVIQVQIHSKVAQHWRAVRDDGLTWEATAPK